MFFCKQPAVRYRPEAEDLIAQLRLVQDEKGRTVRAAAAAEVKAQAAEAEETAAPKTHRRPGTP